MRTIWHVFEERRSREPTALAAVGDRAYSYQDIGERAELLAERIAGSTPSGSLVALEADDAVSAAVGFLAAARCACTVLPLNGQSPAAHRNRILADARPSLHLLATSAGEFAVAETGLDTDVPAREADLADVAYVIYTSGSTGRPKGVVVSHEALVARLSGLATTPGMKPGEGILAMTALSFDISLAEILLPFVAGGYLIDAPREARWDPDVFAAVVEEREPDLIQATPSFWRMVLAGGWAGAPKSRIWCGGEALTPELARRLVEHCLELWNLYGPTEATIWASAARIHSSESVTLGAALPDSGLYLDGPRAPDGSQEGEILLYGAGLALGYFGQPELTRDRFTLHHTPQGRQLVYRTGDRAHQRPDGSLLFLGRTDDQVKLRGHRIELGEIEAVLEEHPHVSAAVVLLRDAERPERSYLEAFVAAGAAADKADIRRWVRERLPAVQCPTQISIQPSLPRTSAGKVDRVRLTEAPPQQGAEHE
ncbi:AMP-binding protein [Streptomyces cellostaticus]|uniref:AMP-binding protein n=1 Tax=Streptomyces cellostaticus TaxID=67285 RepID=UPI002025D0FE|nr:AMP-binding protein [Streptomyces cellostaticus]